VLFFATGFGRGPDVAGRGRPEEFFVAFERASIPILEFIFFGCAALGRVMVKWFPENIRAENFPIIFGVSEMEVPGLIDVLGRRDRVSSRNGEEGEPLVFGDDALA